MHQAVPDEPWLFLKPLSALCGPDDPIIYPTQATRVDYEVSSPSSSASAAGARRPGAREYVLGYMSQRPRPGTSAARSVKTRAKAFDTFTHRALHLPDLDPVPEVERGSTASCQVSNTKGLRLPVEDVVARVSAVMTLLAVT
jgi:2-keto-4-pentenoate hydratase/2-oxohepta-3-ene-1,7-dioic acid hydratase in catechol pathway